MEPSLGGWAKGKGEGLLKDAQETIDRGFRNFCGVWSLHVPVRNYLCTDGDTYYLTDLAKGAMLTGDPGAGDEGKYQDWYPLLEKELGLVAKPEAKIISIGRKVGGFLSKMGLYGHVGNIMHYSGQASGHWGTEIQGPLRMAEYKEFSEELTSVPIHTCRPNRECWPGRDSGDDTSVEQSEEAVIRLRFGSSASGSRIARGGSTGNVNGSAA